MWQRIIITIALIFLGVFFLRSVSQGVTKQIDNQNFMLCESAKTSGNREYLSKCSMYYETGDIKSVRETL